MKKEKIKQLVDVMQAYVNGKTIQYYKVDLSFKIEHPGKPNFNAKWVDVDEEHHFRPDCYDYRIKPEPKYRPFKDVDECWQEMLKHQPFGWLREKKRNYIPKLDLCTQKEYKEPVVDLLIIRLSLTVLALPTVRLSE